jgi:carbonic anhydrase/acetyltransferase-like protein (isoleucine patch superfamily)
LQEKIIQLRPQKIIQFIQKIDQARQRTTAMTKTAKQQRRLDKKDQRKETITTNDEKYMMSKDQQRRTKNGKGQ